MPKHKRPIATATAPLLLAKVGTLEEPHVTEPDSKPPATKKRGREASGGRLYPLKLIRVTDADKTSHVESLLKEKEVGAVVGAVLGR